MDRAAEERSSHDDPRPAEVDVIIANNATPMLGRPLICFISNSAAEQCETWIKQGSLARIDIRLSSAHRESRAVFVFRGGLLLREQDEQSSRRAKKRAKRAGSEVRIYVSWSDYPQQGLWSDRTSKGLAQLTLLGDPSKILLSILPEGPNMDGFNFSAHVSEATIIERAAALAGSC